MKFGFGVDVGGTTVKLAFFREDGIMLQKWEIPTVVENAGEQILPDIARSVERYLRENGYQKDQIIGIGIGVPGPVDRNGVVHICDNLGWGVVDVKSRLQELTGFSIQVGNDANVAALGESWVGGGKGCRNMVLATFGTGVGGGIIVDGKQVCGVHGGGGEIGHMVIEPREETYCNCGKRGCVEQFCSATGIVRLTKKRLEKSGESVLRNKEDFTCKDVFDAAKDGDVLAGEVLEQVYDYMGQFLANICCVVDPEVIVLGGGVSRAGQPFLDGAKNAFDRYVYHASKSVRFSLAALGNDAGVWGAFKLICE